MSDGAVEATGEGLGTPKPGPSKPVMMAGATKLPRPGAIEPMVLGVGAGLGTLGLAAHGAGASFLGAVLGGVAAGLLGGAFWASRRARRHADDLDLMRRAYDASSFGRLVVRPDGQAIYANAAFRNLCGAGEPLQSLQVILGAGAEALTEGTYGRLLAEARRRGEARAEVMQRRSDGDVRWLEVSVHRVAGPEGFVSWGVGDVTARHEMLQVIREEQEKLVAFVENAPIGVYSVDANGRFLFVNHVLADWLGVTAGALTSGGRLHDQLKGEEGAPPFSPFAGGEDNAAGEVKLAGGSGRLRVASVSQRVIPASDGTGLVAHGVVRDLSREREWARALSDSEDRLKSFFAAAPIGLVLLDRFGRIEESNRAFRALIGPHAAEPLGRALVDLVADESRAGLERHLRAAIDEGRAGASIEVKLPAESRVLTASLYISPLEGRRRVAEDGEDQQRSAAGLMVHFIDTTEQRALEAQFAQSQKMQAVGQLAGGIAHDFNNLLTAMIGFCDLLLMRHRPGEESFADIMQIKQNANRAANLVRQLLAFSRQQTLQPKLLDMTDVIADLSNLLRRLIGPKIELKTVHGRDLWQIMADQVQIEQVLINLVVNARDATPGGGSVTIRSRNQRIESPQMIGAEVLPPGDYVVLEVADTGTGIAKEHIGRIYEPFFSTKEVGAGTGLGLSTVYGIVKQTGGHIFVESEVGKGTTFTIYFQRHGEGVAKAAGDATVQAPRDLTGAGTVLLVEDEDAVRQFALRALRNKGYKVLEANSGVGALDILRNTAERIDVLVTDVVMPQIDGPELVREVRKIRPELKIVFISGYAEEAFRKHLDRDLEFAFLPKPFSLQQLATKVKEAMGRA